MAAGHEDARQVEWAQDRLQQSSTQVHNPFRGSPTPSHVVKGCVTVKKLRHKAGAKTGGRGGGEGGVGGEGGGT